MATVEVLHPRPAVAVLRLNRPESLNALSWQLVEELHLDVPSLDVAIQLENRNQIMASASGDTEEAARAFFEKRTPRWQED